ncbi:MAG: hypothetical protein AMJ67_00530 [Betaproteobacteria bacterium SG8_41]|jgi:hypothetical protein|nr:MAG: hypothetical protein AMJ67_00530 [Betaproteobacteria bacterium SG8_41]
MNADEIRNRIAEKIRFTIHDSRQSMNRRDAESGESTEQENTICQQARNKRAAEAAFLGPLSDAVKA